MWPRDIIWLVFEEESQVNEEWKPHDIKKEHFLLAVCSQEATAQHLKSESKNRHIIRCVADVVFPRLRVTHHTDLTLRGG